MSDARVPFVSVVVPVRNDPRIAGCIEGLLGQTYPHDRYEILVVDNGSSDATTRALISRYPVTLLVQDQVRSSYAARNLGIRHARGEIVALIDADCLPTPDWLAEGVAVFDAGGADLAGGHVRFELTERPSGAELYDSATHMQQGKDIRTRNLAKTANLFIRAHVFQAVGLFPETMKSGGDVYWTKRATDAGHRLVFAGRAEVGHPARRLLSLLKKGLRVGRGRFDKYMLERRSEVIPAGGVSRLNPGYTLRNYRPPNRRNLVKALRTHDPDISDGDIRRAWMAGSCYRIVMALGSTTRWAQCSLNGQYRSQQAPSAVEDAGEDSLRVP